VSPASQFTTLNSLRGLAALAIALYHFSGGWAGYLAVDFFLVLSGFILSHSYLYKTTSISLLQFAGNRIARLYPLHVFTLCALVAISLLVGRGIPAYTNFPLLTLIQQLTLTHNIGLPPHDLSWNRIGWIVSVIFWVNLFFFCCIRRNTGSVLLAACSVAGFSIIFFKNGNLDVTAGNYFIVINSGMLRGFCSFFLGILSYRMYLSLSGQSNVKKHATLVESLCLLGILLVVFARTGKYSSLDFLAPFLFMCTLPVFAQEHGYVSRFFQKFSKLGTISYSLFLNQIGVLMAVHYVGEKVQVGIFMELIVYLAVLLTYSWLTWRFIEMPLRMKGKDVLQRLE
jgi:peptidoglycan/LPS O-acetylase OafA/YrhL